MKILENLLWGLKDGVLVNISSVENGLKCECYCPNIECNSKLVAKNNPENIKVFHFAHYKDSDCNNAVESAIHLLAKKILIKEKKIFLPDFRQKSPYFIIPDFVYLGKEIEFENVIAEKNVNTIESYIRPDIIATFKNKELYIEFANTSFVKVNKLNIIKNLNKPCLEIDLKNADQNEESILKILNSNTTEKYWLYNPNLENNAYEYFNLELKKKTKEENQKNIEAEKMKLEILEKFEKYKKDININLLLVSKNGLITNCPKKNFALYKFKNKEYYNHPTLKKIIDGEYWNGEIYGKSPFGKYIYLANEKITIFPADVINKSITEQEKKVNNFFWSGLIEIKKVLNNPTFGDCSKCEFTVDHFSINDRGYEVCKHPKV